MARSSMSTSTSPVTGPESVGPSGLSSDARLAVRLALSRVIGESGGTRAQCYPLARVLAALSGFETEWPNRETRRRWLTGGASILRDLALKPRDLDRIWALARNGDGLLPDDVLDGFFPEELHPAVWMLITAGPLESSLELELLLGCWAQGLTLSGEPRERGPLSTNSVAVYVTAAWTLFRELSELRKRRSRHGLDAFAEWTDDALPKRLSPRKLGAVPALSEVTAPPLLMSRRVLRTLHAEVERRRHVRALWKTSFIHLRDRALIAMLLLLGPRKSAVVEMTVGCFLRDHLFPCGGRGPALVIPPIKGGDRPRIKAIPDVLALWIEEYLEFAGISSDLASPLWRNSRHRDRGLEVHGINGITIRVFAPFAQNGRKYWPHSLRHSAAHVLFLGGLDWLNENRDQLFMNWSGLVASPDTFVDVGLDHAFNSVNGRYLDLGPEPSREAWTRVGVLRAWEYLWGDRGARKMPDFERIRTVAQRVNEANAKCCALEQRLTELETTAARRANALSVKKLLLINMQIGSTARALVAANQERVSAQQELVRAREAKVAVDDMLEDIPSDSGLLSDLATEDEDDRPVLRRWVTAVEFRWALGERIVSPATLRRWLKGRMPYKAGDPRNLWDPNPDSTKPPACVERLSPRKQRIRVDLLDRTRFHADVWARLEELTRRPAPSGW